MTALAPSETPRIIDALGRICAEALGLDDPEGHVFAAGSTEDIVTNEPAIVPLADDFTEAGMPAVTLALGPWTSLQQPGNERLTFQVEGAFWRERVPLGENTAALYAHRDALSDAVIRHGKAFLEDGTIQSVVLKGGPGIRPRSVPRALAAAGRGDRLFLTLPFALEVKCNRAVTAKPA